MYKKMETYALNVIFYGDEIDLMYLQYGCKISLCASVWATFTSDWKIYTALLGIACECIFKGHCEEMRCEWLYDEFRELVELHLLVYIYIYI